MITGDDLEREAFKRVILKHCDEVIRLMSNLKKDVSKVAKNVNLAALEDLVYTQASLIDQANTLLRESVLKDFTK